MSVLAPIRRRGAGSRRAGRICLFRIKKYIVKPECVVNIKTIPRFEFHSLRAAEPVRIGALTTLSQIAQSPQSCSEAIGVWPKRRVWLHRRRFATWERWRGTSARMFGAGICRTDSPVGSPAASFAIWRAATAATTAASWAAISVCRTIHRTRPWRWRRWTLKVHVVSPRGGRVARDDEFLSGHNWVGGRLQSHTLRTRRDRHRNRNSLSPDA